jgi:amidohydrolase
MTDNAELRAQAEALAPQLVAWRRHLHQHPELAFEEVESQRYIMAELHAMGLEPRPLAKTGVVVDIGAPPYVMVRADMDALPVAEPEGFEFRSQNAGVMHACGHDGHMAVALGTAQLLSRGRASGDHGYRVIFQPSEERHPGGAPSMIADGVLEGVSRVIGCHIRPALAVGEVGASEGAQSANSDRFSVTIVGKGGHGSTPHLTVDPVPVACEAVLAVQSVVSRRVPSSQAAVVTVAMLEAGTAPNVIADTASFHGTVRTFDAAVRDLVERSLDEICRGVAAAHGARAEVSYRRGYPSLMNAPAETAALRAASDALLGAAAWTVEPRRMGGEDFAFYQEQRPGVFWSLGAALEGYPPAGHSGRFAFNEAALPIGVAVMVAGAEALAALD